MVIKWKSWFTSGIERGYALSKHIHMGLGIYGIISFFGGFPSHEGTPKSSSRHGWPWWRLGIEAFEQLLSVLLTVFQVTAEERPASSRPPFWIGKKWGMPPFFISGRHERMVNLIFHNFPNLGCVLEFQNSQTNPKPKIFGVYDINMDQQYLVAVRPTKSKSSERWTGKEVSEAAKAPRAGGMEPEGAGVCRFLQ